MNSHSGRKKWDGLTTPAALSPILGEKSGKSSAIATWPSTAFVSTAWPTSVQDALARIANVAFEDTHPEFIDAVNGVGLDCGD